MKLTRILLTATVLCGLSASAQSIDFQFDDDTINGNPSLGASFETAMDGATGATVFDLSSIVAGLNLTVTPSQLGISDTNTGIGIDSGGTLSAAGDALTFSFNKAITLDFLDMGSFTGDGGDSLLLSFTNSNPEITLNNGDFDNNSSNTITFTEANALAANESFSIAWLDGNFAIEAFTVTIVPEPGTFALLAGTCALGFVMLRRRTLL
ncbi:PEP-CTERM sorting domain-containing protein [Coraliomargarita sp. SDUM461004]|uniref:PEP-CTERM sorting domain-containing protein n=1 Tax=Thalassobacterium sedimentorum TaxID=3041258 RepID=A0ABU1AM21_9BACT|nr:PEP-CTERM sorting domain-containing protein [Coraliomargarita sp. SDUM461004]MDQ8194905.1 PEP-CTERM sorting domain-containing protein [Coraliomargarita sp. SDUM461004]